MIERGFITQKTKEYYIKDYIESKLKGVGISQIKLKKIPLGEKIIIQAARPSLIVGSKGSNIRDLTRVLKHKFKLENPQIEINEVKEPFLDANIVAQRIASSLERYGSARFKGVGHKMMENVLAAGALGIEIFISGKIPGARAKSWRFYQGYLKKCGDAALIGVRKAQTTALLKSGIIGIKVAIMPPDLVLPDYIQILDEPVQMETETEKKAKSVKTTTSPRKKRKTPASKKAKKVTAAEDNTHVYSDVEAGENVGEKSASGKKATEKVSEASLEAEAEEMPKEDS